MYQAYAPKHTAPLLPPSHPRSRKILPWRVTSRPNLEDLNAMTPPMATNSSKMAQPGTARITLFYSDKKKFTVGKSFTFPGKAYTCAGMLSFTKISQRHNTCLSQKDIYHRCYIHVTMVYNVIYKRWPPWRRTWSSCSKNMLCFH